jgi:hypothetical protein
MAKQPNLVQAHAAHLQQGLNGLAADGTPVVWGVSDRAIFGSRPRAISQIRDILIESGRVFLHDGNVVYEQRSQNDGRRLVALQEGDCLTRAAPAHLANLFHCAVPGKEDAVTYQPPAKVLAEVLHNAATREQLPRVDWYSRRPVLDSSFRLCQPGYNAAERILVHADAIEPVPWTPPPDAKHPLDRLPPGLRGFLKDFCLHSPADVVNVVGFLLTGVLMNHVVTAGKPVAIFNGNQKGLGKSLLTVGLGIILDGSPPPLLHHTDDQDELAKRLGAKIKPGSANSVLFLDNQRGCIGGSLLESQALAERVSVRMLGHNEDITRANDFLWVFTSNNARAPPRT